MAKDIYRTLNTVELIGTVDINANGELVVYVEQGKEAPTLEINLLDILEENKGKQIALKLTNEQKAV